jgi:hypothetical protein
MVTTNEARRRRLTEQRAPYAEVKPQSRLARLSPGAAADVARVCSHGVPVRACKGGCARMLSIDSMAASVRKLAKSS